MPTLLRNALAILAGIVIGGAVNMALVTLSPALIPPPAGVDVNDAASLGRSMHLFQPRHFVMPFLAHALGTLAGALAAYMVAASHRARFAWVIGAFFRPAASRWTWRPRTFRWPGLRSGSAIA